MKLSAQTCFNLNLLECKFVIGLLMLIFLKVLISTCWNVNDIVLCTTLSPKLVLISTYWNVNVINKFPLRVINAF